MSDAGDPAIPGDAVPRSGWHLGILCFVGDFDYPVFLLRDPKSVSISVCEIHTCGRGVCPRFALGVRSVESLVSSTLGLYLVLAAS